MRQLGRKELTLHLEQRLDAIPPALAGYELRLAHGGADHVDTYVADDRQSGIPALLEAVDRAGLRLRDLQTTQSSLEDIFVSLVKDRR
jgi:ABC-2 type transport system ATP-binding protein